MKSPCYLEEAYHVLTQPIDQSGLRMACKWTNVACLCVTLVLGLTRPARRGPSHAVQRTAEPSAARWIQTADRRLDCGWLTWLELETLTSESDLGLPPKRVDRLNFTMSTQQQRFHWNTCEIMSWNLTIISDETISVEYSSWFPLGLMSTVERAGGWTNGRKRLVNII